MRLSGLKRLAMRVTSGTNIGLGMKRRAAVGSFTKLKYCVLWFFTVDRSSRVGWKRREFRLGSMIEVLSWKKMNFSVSLE